MLFTKHHMDCKCLKTLARVSFVVAVLACPAMAKDYAILIGVGDYGRSPDFADVPSATYETMEFSQILKDQVIDGEKQFEEVITLCDAPKTAVGPDLDPTKENIVAQLRKLRDKIRSEDPERAVHDSLIVVLDGHGVEIKEAGAVDPVFSFCLKGATFADKTARLTITEIIDCLSESHGSNKRVVPEQLLLVVNACRNQPYSAGLDADAGRKWKGAKDDIGRSAKNLEGVRGIAVLFACGENQRSYINLKHKSDNKDKRSYFFTALMHGWSGAADAVSGDRDGKISISELTSYLRSAVGKQTEKEDGKQIPEVWTPDKAVDLPGWIVNKSVVKTFDKERKIITDNLPRSWDPDEMQDWSGYRFVGVQFPRKIHDKVLDDCIFVDCDLEGVKFTNLTTLSESRFIGCKMKGTDFSKMKGTLALNYEGSNEDEDQIIWGNSKRRPSFFAPPKR